MARITQGEVEEIFINTAGVNLTAFITVANILVTKVLGGAGLEAAHLKEIERWLAAHFACIRDPREASVMNNKAQAVFQGRTDMGLNHTSYGQQVLLLDTTGKLNEQLGKPSAGFAVVSHDELPDSNAEGWIL